MPTVYLMCGVPASGKSTFIKGSKELKDLPVASSDAFIEAYAELVGKTYDEVFSEAIGEATSDMESLINKFIKEGTSFIWDQTNLTKKTRAKKMSRIPNNWKKVCVFLATPEKEEWEARLNSRPGKTIPKKILESMLNQLEVPTLIDEDFNYILSNVNMDQYH